MCKRLSGSEVAPRPGASGTPRALPGLVLLAILVLPLLSGCGPRDSEAERERAGGFYGGVSGGVSRP